MSRQCFLCMVLFLDLSIPVPMLTISYQILYCQVHTYIKDIWYTAQKHFKTTINVSPAAKLAATLSRETNSL